uniref:Uncharacterized protein n=1 Tax=Euplotes harpa TaxID=151035 RepID=A0A7S3N6B0_9SPIT|mmetsp:Transcript_15708/g.18147  ORF Transcript_15708/g.18147 Transcript_15708/m.18147 type:complete len:333 (+) Transcript_15708:4-1002(+)
MEASNRMFLVLAKRLELAIKILEYYNFLDKSIVLWRRLCSDTRKQAIDEEGVFRSQLKIKRKFSVYKFDDKVKTLLLGKEFQLIKYFEIDTYLDSRSRVASFHEFLVELRDKKHEGLSLEDLQIFQIYMVKSKEYHEEIIKMVSSIINIDKISFDSLRLSKIRDEYCITDEVVRKFDNIVDFFLSISDKLPEYIKFFQIKGIHSIKQTIEFLQTCPIEIEILDMENVIPDVDISCYKLSSLLCRSLEKITVSFELPQYIAKISNLIQRKKNKKFTEIEEDEDRTYENKKLSNVCDGQMRLFAQLLNMVCQNNENKTMLELKLSPSNCRLYFK